MPLTTTEHQDGTYTVSASGREKADLRGAFGDVAARERDARLSGEHPLHHAPGVGMLFHPPENIVRWDGGKIVYRERGRNGEWQQVEDGWILVA